MRINPIIPAHDAPCVEKVFTFDDQTRFITSGTGLIDPSYNILPQPLNQPIVPSTKDEVQEPGYALALAPDSEVPLMVVFNAGGQATSSSPQRILPGQILRPHGVRTDGQSGSFSGFSVGLPFGWLGGGTARVFILKNEDAITWFMGEVAQREICFHRIALKIGTENIKPNWPVRFPWINAVSQLDEDGAVVTKASAQGGKPALVIRPTRTILTVQTPGLPAEGVSSGNFIVKISDAEQTSVDCAFRLSFPGVPASVLTSSSVLEVVGGALNDLNGDDAILSLLLGDDATLNDIWVDIARFGIL